MNIEALRQFAACGPDGFIPTWHRYLTCDSSGTPDISGDINNIWLIGWGIIDLILFVGSIAAVFFLIYGGILFITSQGAPDKTAQARKTITYAIAGLVISIIGQAVVRFIGNSFGADVGV